MVIRNIGSILTCLLCLQCLGETSINEIIEERSYFEEDRFYTIEEVISLENQGKFLNSDRKINFSSSSNSFWLKLKFKKGANDPSNYLLEVGYPALSHLWCYEVNGDNILSEQVAGSRLPFSTRTHPFRDNVVEIHLADSLSHIYYLHIQSAGNMIIPLRLISEETYRNQNLISTLEIGIGVGLFLLISILTFILFLFIGNRSYLLYSIYILVVAAFILVRNGFGTMYLWPEDPSWNQFMMRFSSYGKMAFASLFANYFLDIKSYSSRQSFLLKTIAFIYLFLSLIMVLGISPADLPRVAYLSLIHSLIMGIIGIIALQKQQKHAFLYTIGMILLSVIKLIHILALYDYLPNIFSSLLFTRIGWYSEVLFLTLAVGRSYRDALLENRKLHEQKTLADSQLAVSQYSLNNSQKEKEVTDRKLVTANLESLHQFNSLQVLKGELNDSQSKYKIDKLISSSATNFQWKNFKLLFEEIHPEFFNELLSNYPELTTNELRHLALIKMNLSTKEIAQIFIVKPTSIQVARHRLKRKLHLTEQDDLIKLVQQL